MKQEDDQIGDTGLLRDTGMVHGSALSEFDLDSDTSESLTVLQIAKMTSGGQQPLERLAFALRSRQARACEETSELRPFNLEDNMAQYCFVTDKEILTSSKIPKREVKRLVIFFHHLDDEARYKLLPILDSYFKGDRINDLELPVALQRWFRQIEKLDPRERQMLAIWLTRYCFAPSATLKEFEAAKDVVYVNDRHTDSAKPNKSERRSRLFFLKLILPGVWILATAVLIIFESKKIAPTTSKHIPSICNSTIGSIDYCRLAVDLVGEKKLARLSGNLFPMTEVTEAVASYSCEKYANLKAGIPTPIAHKTPVVSSYGEKIFPHIYIVEVRQKNQQSGEIRVGCVYTTGRGQRSPKLLAADIIPDNSSNSQQSTVNSQQGTLQQ